MVTEFTPLAGLAGGVLIGLAAVLLMGGIGRDRRHQRHLRRAV
jgi:hypothetical protein